MKRNLVLLVAMTLGACESATEPEPEPALEAASIALAVTPPLTVRSRVMLQSQPVIQLRDALGAAVGIAGVQVAVPVDPGIILGNSTVATNAQGMATFSDLAIGGKRGLHTLTFSAPGLPQVSALVDLVAGVPARVFVTGADQTWLAGASLLDPISLTLTDEDENPISGQTITTEVATGGGSVTGATGITNILGSFRLGSWTLGPAPGANTLTISAAETDTKWTLAATGVAPTATCGEDASLVVGSQQYGWVRASQCTIIDPLQFQFGFPSAKRFTGPEPGGTYFYDRYLIDIPAGAIVRIDADNDSFSERLMAFDMNGTLVAEEFLRQLTLDNPGTSMQRRQILVIPSGTGETGPYQIRTERLN